LLIVYKHNFTLSHLDVTTVFDLVPPHVMFVDCEVQSMFISALQNKFSVIGQGIHAVVRFQSIDLDFLERIPVRTIEQL